MRSFVHVKDKGGARSKWICALFWEIHTVVSSPRARHPSRLLNLNFEFAHVLLDTIWTLPFIARLYSKGWLIHSQPWICKKKGRSCACAHEPLPPWSLWMCLNGFYCQGCMVFVKTVVDGEQPGIQRRHVSRMKILSGAPPPWGFASRWVSVSVKAVASWSAHKRPSYRDHQTSRCKAICHGTRG